MSQKTDNCPPRVLGITLVRGGSKSIPRKNIKPLIGIPLIAHTIKEAKKSKYLTRYIISTEDDEIAKISKEYGAEVPFMRPAELATDSASSKSALQHAVRFMEELEGQAYDYIVELMATNPLKIVDDIDAAIEKLINTKADSVIGVVQLEDHHPARIKKIVDDRIVDFCIPEPNEARRQDLKPEAYIRNGSIYAMKRDILMVQDRRYGTKNSRPYYFPSERSVNLDTMEDWYIAEYRLKNTQ